MYISKILGLKKKRREPVLSHLSLDLRLWLSSILREIECNSFWQVRARNSTSVCTAKDGHFIKWAIPWRFQASQFAICRFGTWKRVEVGGLKAETLYLRRDKSSKWSHEERLNFKVSQRMQERRKKGIKKKKLTKKHIPLTYFHRKWCRSIFLWWSHTVSVLRP